MNWYFLRHGEIRSNVDKVYSGWSDEALTGRGVRQVREAAGKVRDLGIRKIYCSPLKRTVQTAQIIGEYLSVRHSIEKGFIELRIGPWEGMRESDIAEQYPEQWQIWNTRPGELKLEGRETLQELQDRVLGGLGKIQSDGVEPVLIVTHVAIIRVMLLYSKNLDLNLYKTIDVPNAEIFEIAFHNL